MKYPKNKKAAILARIESGESANSVAKDLQMPVTTIYSWIKASAKPKVKKKASSRAQSVDCEDDHVCEGEDELIERLLQTIGEQQKAITMLNFYLDKHHGC
jgi:hypothetical protein